jgi:hypothetical protein
MFPCKKHSIVPPQQSTLLLQIGQKPIFKTVEPNLPHQKPFAAVGGTALDFGYNLGYNRQRTMHE